MRYLLIVTAACLAAAFGMVAPSSAGDALRPSDLNKNPKKYDGQMVVVEGVLLIDNPNNDHLQALYDSKTRLFWMNIKEKIGLGESDKHPDKGCLTLFRAHLIWDKDDNPRLKRAKVRGIFVENLDPEMFFLARCLPDTMLVIKEVIEIE